MNLDPIPSIAESRRTMWESMSAAHKANVASPRSEAEAALLTWGAAFKDAKKVRSCLKAEYIFSRGARELRQLLDRNRAKQKDRQREASERAPKPRGLTCDDDTVERAIIALTELDADERQLASLQGWSSSTGPGGHWCHAMLGIDKALAIKEGRRLIAAGGHQEQLRKLGIDVGAAA